MNISRAIHYDLISLGKALQQSHFDTIRITTIVVYWRVTQLLHRCRPTQMLLHLLFLLDVAPDLLLFVDTRIVCENTIQLLFTNLKRRFNRPYVVSELSVWQRVQVSLIVSVYPDKAYGNGVRVLLRRPLFFSLLRRCQQVRQLLLPVILGLVL